MKKTYSIRGLLCFLLFSITTSVFAQEHNHSHDHPHDEFYKFGELVAEKVNFTDTEYPTSIVKRNIKFVFSLEESANLNILKMEMIDRYDKGWYLQVEFEVNDEIGLYQREIREVNNEFFISIVGNARTCICTDCEKLEFSRFSNNCDCVKSKQSGDPKVTYRVFSASN